MWLPRHTVDKSFVLSELPDELEDSERVIVREGSLLLESPDGPAFGSIRTDRLSPEFHPWFGEDADHWVQVKGLEIEEDGSRLVVIDTEEARVFAYVDREDWRRPRGGWGYGSSHSYGCQGMPLADNVDVGTELYDAVDGEVVGRVTAPTWLSVVEDESGWVRTNLGLGLDNVELYLAAEDVGDFGPYLFR